MIKQHLSRKANKILVWTSPCYKQEKQKRTSKMKLPQSSPKFKIQGIFKKPKMSRNEVRENKRQSGLKKSLKFMSVDKYLEKQNKTSISTILKSAYVLKLRVVTSGSESIQDLNQDQKVSSTQDLDQLNVSFGSSMSIKDDKAVKAVRTREVLNPNAIVTPNFDSQDSGLIENLNENVVPMASEENVLPSASQEVGLIDIVSNEMGRMLVSIKQASTNT